MRRGTDDGAGRRERAGTSAGGMPGGRRREGFQGEEVVFGSNGRTRSVTRRVYPREYERRDARAREFARSPARSLAPLAVLR